MVNQSQFIHSILLFYSRPTQDTVLGLGPGNCPKKGTIDIKLHIVKVKHIERKVSWFGEVGVLNWV